MKKAVLVDIDDTIADTQVGILSYVNERASRRYDYEELDRRFREGGLEPEYDRLVREFLRTPELVAQARPYESALEGLKRLHEAGYEVHVASARKENLHDVTAEWLKRHGLIEYVTRIHPRMKTHRGPDFKKLAAEAAKAVAAFDDTYDVAEALAGTGVRVYLIEKPWNRHEPEAENIVPVHDFSEAVERFLMDQTPAG